MSTPIEELTALVNALRAETFEQSITPERMGAILQRMIDILPSVSDVNSLKGWVAITSINDLPTSPSPSQQALAYLLDTTLYVYVGSGGDTLGGKYKSVDMKGPKGNPGTPLGETEIVDNLESDDPEKVLSANQGRVLKGMINSKTFPIVNDLTTGGEASALSAAMGKELKDGRARNYTPTNIVVGSGWDLREGWASTDFIPCAAGDTVVWNIGLEESCTLCFYDADKTFLTSFGQRGVQRTVTAPANSAYLRATFYLANVSVPVIINGVEHPIYDNVVGDGNLATVPKVITENFYGYFYDCTGVEVVPKDAMRFANMTFGKTSHEASYNKTRAIAEFPVKYGYGLIVRPKEGFRTQINLFTYKDVGISQANSNTFLWQEESYEKVIVPIMREAHMAVVWITNSGNTAITLDEARNAFEAKIVKLPENYYIKGINHRGYFTRNNNTLTAFRESRRQGFRYVEADVRCTSDGVLVLLHNTTINATARNADGTEISESVEISNITYEQALEYDFGISMGEQFAGEKIPTLTQFLSLCKSIGLHPYLDLKIANDDKIAQVVNEVQNAGMRGHVTYIGTDKLTVIKNIDPYARLAILGEVSALRLYDSLKTETNEVIADISDVTNLATFKERGIPVEVYTYDTSSNILALDSYVSGVTSNKWDAGALKFLDAIE